MDFYGMGGHGVVRLRETYLRDFVAPSLNSGASGLVKVDLALRALAARDEDPGTVTAGISWDEIHDLCRPASFYGSATRLKRQWVSDKLERLVALGLLERTLTPGGRSQLRVLRDDGSRLPLDDPGANGDSYVPFLGGAFKFDRVAAWGTPEIAMYFAAMIAERYARSDPQLEWLQKGRKLGGGVWLRPLDWFADSARNRPETHVRIAFSTRTLRRGLHSLREEGLIAFKRVRENPRTGHPFKGPHGRYVYFNGFDDFRGPHRRRPPDWAALLRSPENANPRQLALADEPATPGWHD